MLFFSFYQIGFVQGLLSYVKWEADSQGPEKFDRIAIDLSWNQWQKIPDNIIKICESGINNNKQLYEYSKNGADAFLIGESLMKSEDIEIATKNLIKK